MLRSNGYMVPVPIKAERIILGWSDLPQQEKRYSPVDKTSFHWSILWFLMILALVIPAPCLNNRFLYPVHEKINLAIIAQFKGIVSHDSAQHRYTVNPIKHPGFWKASFTKEFTATRIQWDERLYRLWLPAHQTKNPAKKQGFCFETIKRIISRAPSFSSWKIFDHPFPWMRAGKYRPRHWQ